MSKEEEAVQKLIDLAIKGSIYKLIQEEAEVKDVTQALVDVLNLCVVAGLIQSEEGN